MKLLSWFHRDNTMEKMLCDNQEDNCSNDLNVSHVKIGQCTAHRLALSSVKRKFEKEMKENSPTNGIILICQALLELAIGPCTAIAYNYRLNAPARNGVTTLRLCDCERETKDRAYPR